MIAMRVNIWISPAPPHMFETPLSRNRVKLSDDCVAISKPLTSNSRSLDRRVTGEDHDCNDSFAIQISDKLLSDGVVEVLITVI